MAQTIGFGDLDDQENQNNQQNQQGSNTPGAGQSGNISGGAGGSVGGSSNTTGQSSGVAAGAPTSGGNAAAPARPATYNQQNQGTGFTNLQNYVGANNPSQLQQTIAQGLENQNQSVLSNLGTAQTQFGQQQAASQANTNANQQAIKAVLSNPAAFTNVTGVPAGTTAAAQAAAGGAGPSQANLAQGNLFSQLLGGQYGGPTSLANQQALQGQATSAQQTAQGLTSPGGRQAVLQQILGNPNYNSGEQQFDASLLGQGSSPALNTAAAQANALQGIVGQAGASATAQGQEQQNTAQQFGAQTQGQFGQTVGNLNAQLQQQAGAAQGNKNAAYQQLLTDAASGNVTQQEANLLGVTGGEQVTNNILSGINSYITPEQQQANAQNVASQQNYATIDALRQLAGSNAPATAAATLGQYQGQEGQAGSFAAQPQANVNTGALGTQISTDVNAYNAPINAAQGNLNSADTYNRWANNGGGLNASDYQQATGWGINPQLIQAAQQEGGPGPAQEALGQALWNASLNVIYGGGNPNNYNANIGGNSRFLNSDWTSGQVQQDTSALNAARAQSNATYGGISNFNIQNPTAGALQAMAQGTQINRNT
jgi:hypothetical protein